MKFNRQALISAVDAALEDYRREWEKRYAKDLETHAELLGAWMRKYGAAWSEAGLKIRKAIREGRPVTSDLLPEGHYRDVATFSEHASLDRTYAPPQQLTMLRRLLETVVDEEVSSSGLEAVGITSRIMREAAMFMTEGTVRT